MKSNVLVYKEAKWIGHICLLKHTIEGKIERTMERAGTREVTYWELITHFGELGLEAAMDVS